MATELVKGKTLIVVAHRLATIQDADNIMVVEHGKITGCGKHQELLSDCPLYERLWSNYMDTSDSCTKGADENAVYC